MTWTTTRTRTTEAGCLGIDTFSFLNLLILSRFLYSIKPSFPIRQLRKTLRTEFVVEVDLLRYGSCRYDRQDIRDQQVHLLAGTCFADGQADTLAGFRVAPPTINKGWVKSVHVVMLT